MKTFDDLIPPTPDDAGSLGDILAGTTMPNMTFAGPAGCGKTTAARALMNQMGMDTLLDNSKKVD